MKYDAVIFDMDGTILDTLEDLAAALNDALERNGLPRRTREEVRRFVGNGIRKLIERGVPAGTGASVVNKVQAAFTEYYRVHYADTTRPYGGIPELIRILRQGGCKTAVVSNKPDYGVQELCDKYFDGLFDYAVGERQGIRKKPAPDSVFEVLKRFQCPPERAVYIGDSEVDVETARNAGVACICVDWGYRDREFLAISGAENIVSDAKALLSEL
ncbi:HAD family hydrolase [Papillibacter cinnamivorans]|uniref:Phosphoglycolate phosphatase n=1 Tax=Papillibacter cinnamivorans DSM 12816 TaxID=1122930 RepID=A0A1W1ZG19_9FIRM|nr:HAD family hydrolase [Papillibacter cinnamivorans]SMC47354.1 phosphoglycolate phosphatase [Papillibacter cinnamivorans DSM 12816]